eukprot:6163245-Pyramimonas_sp.AAC.1
MKWHAVWPWPGVASDAQGLLDVLGADRQTLSPRVCGQSRPCDQLRFVHGLVAKDPSPVGGQLLSDRAVVSVNVAASVLQKMYAHVFGSSCKPGQSPIDG